MTDTITVCIEDGCQEQVSNMWDGDHEEEAMCDEHHEQAATSAWEEAQWEAQEER
jgi:hypothetical protein